jgi:RNA polymerase sigma factor (sigma-70 family)
MDPIRRNVIERQIHAYHSRGDYEAAATVSIQQYGAALLGYLMGVVSDEDQACEIFADACEDLWRGINGFAWRSSFWTWANSITRHACFRHLHRQRLEPSPLNSAVTQLQQQVRSVTLPYLRTSFKDRITKLREQLDERDRTLLYLRVDCEMSWTEIAEVLVPPDEHRDPEALQRTAARCRKRFERAKLRLRRLALAEGLLTEGTELNPSVS